MPREGRSIYPLGRCVQWYIAYQVNKPSNQFSGRGATARATREELQAQMLQQKMDERAGNLVSKMDVYTVFGNGMLRLGAALDGVPAIIGRRLGLTPDQVKMIRAELDQLRRTFARDCEKYADAADRIAEEKAKADAGTKKRSSRKAS